MKNGSNKDISAEEGIVNKKPSFIMILGVLMALTGLAVKGYESFTSDDAQVAAPAVKDKPSTSNAVADIERKKECMSAEERAFSCLEGSWSGNSVMSGAVFANSTSERQRMEGLAHILQYGQVTQSENVYVQENGACGSILTIAGQYKGSSYSGIFYCNKTQNLKSLPDPRSPTKYRDGENPLLGKWIKTTASLDDKAIWSFNSNGTYEERMGGLQTKLYRLLGDILAIRNAADDGWWLYTIKTIDESTIELVNSFPLQKEPDGLLVRLKKIQDPVLSNDKVKDVRQSFGPPSVLAVDEKTKITVSGTIQSTQHGYQLVMTEERRFTGDDICDAQISRSVWLESNETLLRQHVGRMVSVTGVLDCPRGGWILRDLKIAVHRELSEIPAANYSLVQYPARSESEAVKRCGENPRLFENIDLEKQLKQSMRKSTATLMKTHDDAIDRINSGRMQQSACPMLAEHIRTRLKVLENNFRHKSSAGKEPYMLWEGCTATISSPLYRGCFGGNLNAPRR